MFGESLKQSSILLHMVCHLIAECEEKLKLVKVTDKFLEYMNSKSGPRSQKIFLKLRLQLHSCLISYGSGSAPAPDKLRQFYFPVWDFNSQYLL